MRTRFYIDGYNFYFGCLKGTHHKWLNLVKLSELLLVRSGTPQGTLHPISPIKYFTADISELAAADPSSVMDQRTYHRALTNHCAQQLEIIKGGYAIDKVKFPKVESDVHGMEKEPKDSGRVQVWKMEEKQTDVNIALEAVYDAILEESIDQVVFVTNDTDLVPALKKIKEMNQLGRRSSVNVGLIIPARNDHEYRKPNKILSDHADWVIKHIMEDELIKAALPCRVPTKRGPAIKPISWFKYPGEVQSIIDVLAQNLVTGSEARAWKWLTQPLLLVDGLPAIEGRPIDHLDSLDDLEVILQHARAYAEYKISTE